MNVYQQTKQTEKLQSINKQLKKKITLKKYKCPILIYIYIKIQSCIKAKKDYIITLLNKKQMKKEGDRDEKPNHRTVRENQ